MATQNHIDDLQNQYFDLQRLFEIGEITEAQQVQLDKVKAELKELPNNVLSTSVSKPQKTYQQKISRSF